MSILDQMCACHKGFTLTRKRRMVTSCFSSEEKDLVQDSDSIDQNYTFYTRQAVIRRKKSNILNTIALNLAEEEDPEVGLLCTTGLSLDRVNLLNPLVLSPPVQPAR